jgi:ubiquinone/menaquinone biosynthesis C-methylase UbiE
MNEERDSSAGNFYDRIADVHNLAMKLNGYRRSVGRFLRSLDLDLPHDAVVLDAGSGTGIVTLGLHSSGLRPSRTVALDLSHNSLKVSRGQFDRDRDARSAAIDVVQGNILELPFADGSFDLVLTCGVLEYVPLDQGLAEIARVMKGGAKLVLIPVKPSLVGSVLEILYKFKTHPVEKVRETAAKSFTVVGNYEFPITEPIGWSKNVFVLEKP